jgi:hypothetical protein
MCVAACKIAADSQNNAAKMLLKTKALKSVWSNVMISSHYPSTRSLRMSVVGLAVEANGA